MEIKIRNNQNIYRSSLKPQNMLKNGCFSNNSLKNDVFVKRNIAFKGLNPNDILRPFEKFGIAEYKKLIPEQIEALRASLNKELIENRNITIAFSNIVKTNLDKAYPKGYVFIPVGRSPAVIGKALEYQGVDVKYCPISLNKPMFGRGNDLEKFIFNSAKIAEYNKYLTSINLSRREIKNSNKVYVFADYTHTGKSLKGFKEILEGSEIKIKSANVFYKSINNDIISKNKGNKKLSTLSQIIFNYFHSSNVKTYVHYDKLYPSDMHNVKRIMDQQYSEPCKQMNFALIDYFAQRGLLKE